MTKKPALNGVFVKVPETSNPYRVIINGRKEDLPAGKSINAPPEIAAVINAADNFPPAAQEVKPPFAGGGGGGGVLVVHVVRTVTDESETYTLDKTWQELADALNSGKTLSFVEWDSNGNIGGSYSWSISYLIVGLNVPGFTMNLETDSPDGYPTATIPF